MNAVLWGRLLQLKKNSKIMILMTLLTIVFSFIFGLSNTGDSRIQVPVANEDGSVISERLIERLNESESFVMVPVEREVLLQKVREGESDIGLIIPAGIADTRYKEKVLQVVKVKDSPETLSFEGLLISSMQNVLVQSSIIDASIHTFERMDTDFDANKAEERIAYLVEEKWQNTLPVEVETRLPDVGDGGDKFIYDQKLQTLLGFTLFFTMYTIIFSVGEILNDRKHLVWERMIVSPLSKFQLYMGNLIYSFVVSYLQISILILFGKYVIGVNWGDHISIVFVITALFVFAQMALGMLLVSFVRTPQQFQAIVPVIAVSSAMIGGAYWPLEIVSSKILLMVSKLVPLTYAMSSIKEVILYNKGWETAWGPALTLLLMGVILMVAGVYRIERKAG